MDKKEYICIKREPDSYWKIGKKYEFRGYEIIIFELNIKSHDFKEFFLDKQEYRELQINKILENG